MFLETEIANLEAKGVKLDIDEEGDITREAITISKRSILHNRR